MRKVLLGSLIALCLGVGSAQTAESGLHGPALAQQLPTEGFYFADSPTMPPQSKYSNSLLYLFQSPESPANMRGSTVVVGPRYKNTNTIGSFLSPYAVAGTPMPDESSQLDFRYGHLGFISHNWITDPYTWTPNATNTICLGDKDLSDRGGNTGGYFQCSYSAFYSSVPGWNANPSGGYTLVQAGQFIKDSIWGAGIKSVIEMPVYMGGIGDTFLLDSDGIYKPGWSGASDEGLKLIRLAAGEAEAYIAKVSSYTPVARDSLAPTAGNVLIVSPNLHNRNQEVGVGHPMLDTEVSFSSKSGKVVKSGFAASILEDTNTPAWPASISGAVQSSSPSASDFSRLPNSGLATLTEFTLENLTGELTAGQIIGLCGSGTVNVEGGKSGCQLSYEQAQVNSVLTKYNPATRAEKINAYVRFAHPAGSGVNGGGLVGSYISFDDYTNGPLNDGQMYVQNVFSNTEDTLAFGIIRAGTLTSYPEPSNVPIFPYHLWRGGTVYDVRDPEPSKTPCGTDSSSVPMTNSADGCYFIIEDNNRDFPKGGAWRGAVKQTNYAAANWMALYSAQSVANPYASYTGLDVITPTGIGAGYTGAVGIRVGGVGNGLGGFRQVLAVERGLSQTGLFSGPTLLQGVGYFGEGWTMTSTPYGAYTNHPDLIDISHWTPCSSASPAANCSLVKGTTTKYYQTAFTFLEMHASFDGINPVGYYQDQKVFRDGKYQFDNYGTTFQLVQNFPANAAVITSSIESGAAGNTDIAGELNFNCTGMPCTAIYPFKVTGYRQHPECIVQPQFNTVSVGAPWITYTGTTSMTVNFASPATGTVSYVCVGRN